jgi:LPXTG-motif cell wall-anchored protein
MNVKYLSGVTGVVLACAVGTVQPAYAQRRDGNLLPQDKSGQVTAVGCLVRGNAVRGGKADKYVLARPRTGPVASVTEASCTADTGADALTLDNPEKAAIKDSMLGRWVQITGRLESETSKDPDNLRELDVVSAKMVTVVPPPRAATAAPRPSTPAAAADSRPASSPAAQQASAAPATGTTAAPRSLPKTASQLPALGFVGLLMLAGGVLLRAVRLRQRG